MGEVLDDDDQRGGPRVQPPPARAANACVSGADDLGLTQKQVITRLARLGVGSTNKALSSLEHGAGLDVAKLPELAVALECSVTWLLGLTDEPRSWEPTGAYAPRRRGAEAAPSRPAARSVDGSGWSDRSGAAGTPPHPGPPVR